MAQISLNIAFSAFDFTIEDIKPIQGNVVSVIPEIGSEFYIELSISEIRIENGKIKKFNVFQIAKPGTSNQDTGNKLIALNFRAKPKNKQRFEIITELNGKRRVLKTPPLQISSQDGNVDIFEGPFDFEIFQTKNEKDKLVTIIGFNGTILSTKVNKSPMLVQDAELYISYLDVPPLDCNIDYFKLLMGNE